MTSALRLGCIADDLTGATDLALMLAREGMRVVQTTGCPASDLDLGDADAVVVALKSRTIPAAEAVAQSLAAAAALKERGAAHLFFKYCSTFDSTDAGNIGPVAEALLDATGSDLTIACPAFPANRRTVYRGHLFVGDLLLSDSSMKDHPLTPMRDANLVRVLQRQTRLRVGLVPYEIVAAGAEAIRAAFARARAAGERIVVVDAVSDAQLRTIGAAVHDLAVVTGGSGVAMGLPAAWGFAPSADAAERMPAPAGRQAVLAGSCSAATRGQVAAALAAGLPAFRVDPLDLAAGRLAASAVVDWAVRQPADGAVMIYSSADPDDVARAQAALGRERAGSIVEELLGVVARELAARGFTRLVIAGGETSGAVVAALGVRALRIGPEIAPGVPWTRTLDGTDLALALKSGNFGAEDFFTAAFERLQPATVPARSGH
ncbi:MAG: four-carbon acid sugar kinase family protein [Rhodovulum sp.]|nr:four-carbon acid sugar kinase family protein [Rhodovulum sp.]